MPKFKAPYGTGEQHVTSPTQHLGYRYMVAYLVDNGFGRERIIIACTDAAAEGAPKDAISRQGVTGWYRRSDIIDTRTCRRYDAYAAALTQYEIQQRQERATRQ
jgi:hypothetical protein